jgi:peptide deformylase
MPTDAPQTHTQTGPQPRRGTAHADPAALRLQVYPAPVLRTRAEPVGDVNNTVRAVAERMIEIMDESQGIGLAAPQVGLPWRMFVAHVPEDPGDEETEPRHVQADPVTATAAPTVYIDPEFSDASDGLEPFEEGCLSLPGIRGDVRRPYACTITYTTLDGRRVSERGAGLLARCWQHEADHLDGVLIVDKFSQSDERKNRKPLRELERAALKEGSA